MSLLFASAAVVFPNVTCKQMKTFLQILTAVCISLLFACNKAPVSDADIESKARLAIEGLDSATIEIFKTWHYRSRGQSVDVWTKNREDSAGYRVILLHNPDYTELFVMGASNFHKDFPIALELDTVKYWRCNFKQEGSLTSISAIDTTGKDITYKDLYKTEELFPIKDPFAYFLQLSQIKDSLGILEIFHKPELGDFIEFYISPQHVLTYIPDTSTIDPRFRQVWINKFAKGETINNVWNLRKVDRPLDGG